MNERVYPGASGYQEPLSAIGDADIAKIIINAREADYTKVEAKLDALSISGSPQAVNRVSDQIDDEMAAMASVNPLDYDTGADYKAALTAVAHHLVVDFWLDGLKDKYSVDTFGELKAALAPQE
jgi:hypothetical protein